MDDLLENETSIGSSPEVGLLRFLLEVKADQRFSQAHRNGRATHRVHDEGDEKRRIDAVQDAGEGDEVDCRIQDGHAETQCRVRELPGCAP